MSSTSHDLINISPLTGLHKAVICVLLGLLSVPCGLFASIRIAPDDPVAFPDTVPLKLDPVASVEDEEVRQAFEVTPDSLVFTGIADTIPVRHVITGYNEWEPRAVEFSPNPTRAVWLSALFPGLGQIYNRRYWKLPIVIGAYLGLGYGCSWNNTMLNDYTRAYRDIMDSDPTTKSYMDFFPPTTKEEDLDKTWLTNILKSRRDYFRRNRDLCIIAMVGMYFIAMVDAYVDASLSHFDITPDLSLDVAPAVMKDSRMTRPALGLSWAINF